MVAAVLHSNSGAYPDTNLHLTSLTYKSVVLVSCTSKWSNSSLTT
jgi:hypothetical protein